ncbi:unnamed protein product [Camellia sinensis]
MNLEGFIKRKKGSEGAQSHLSESSHGRRVTCYDLIVRNMWSGAYQCWRKENREGPLRKSYSNLYYSDI